MPSPFPYIKTYAAFGTHWQYVLSYNTASQLWLVSTKPLGRVLGPRVDLGYWSNRSEAEGACYQWEVAHP